MSKIFSVIIGILLISAALCFPQKSGDIRVTVDLNFDVRNVSKEYLNDANLWPYILKYNNIQNLSEIKTGMQILIPKDRVKGLFIRLDEASKKIGEAVQEGAKVLASDILEKSIDNYQQALKQKDEFDYSGAETSALLAIDFAGEAYGKTKEIREKTIDAIISFKKGTVQKMLPSILKWEDARIYENLRENDWARTLSLSLADITFYDLSQIKLNENSQALIQSSRFDVLKNQTTTKVKLEKGDAYALLLSSPKKKFDLDIPGVKTKINSKYFWVEKSKDKSKLANYNGEIALAVKDSTVTVKKNQGSVIPSGGFPSKPRTLLAAPRLLNPDNLVNLQIPGSTFTWSNVKGTSSYWIEISRDAQFKKVYNLTKEITTNSYSISGFLPGAYYWHVCSADSLGLPGPYSAYQSFVVTAKGSMPFLELNSPKENLETRSEDLIIHGRTDRGCKVTVNNKNIVPDTAGIFKAEIKLAEGLNKITVTTKNADAETSVERTVYLESDSIVVIDDSNFGRIENNKKIIYGDKQIAFHLITKPFSRISLKINSSGKSSINNSDKDGRVDFVVHLVNSKEQINLTVVSPTHYQKSVAFEVIAKSELPSIILDPSLENFTGSNHIRLNGKVLNADQLFINNKKVNLDKDNQFESGQMLSLGSNVYEIKAADSKGNICVIEKKIFYDDQPPKLLSCSVNKENESASLYKVLVKAEDETSVRKTAEVEYRIAGNTKKDILEYSAATKMFECEISSGGREKPVIERITLEDYLSNKKTYNINK